MLAMGIVFAGCDTGDDGDGGLAKVGGLPEFEGTFVASEAEATALASAADTQIQAAINQALAQGPQSNIAGRAAVAASGHYEYNGVSVDYTVSGNTSSSTYPFDYKIKEVVTIDGTYGGYKIKGNYNLDLDYTFTSAAEYSITYKYDCWYTVSYNGTGMKVIATGDMILTSQPEYIWNLHYAVYDNSNVLRFNYDYNYSY
jgi:hypothetical protein